MKDKKKIEILLKVIERVYTKNPGTQNLIDESMIDICKEGVSSEQVFFVFLCYWFYRYGLSKHKFFTCKLQLMKIVGFVFICNLEKNSCRIF